MRRSARALALLVATSVVWAPAARAQTPPAPTPEAPAPRSADAAPVPGVAEGLSPAARREYDAAKALFALGDVKGAFYKFQAAYELQPDPRLLWNMATCAKTQHQYAEALRLVRRYERLAAPLLSAADRDEARRAAEAFEALTGALVLRPSQAGAEITVDGVRVEAVGEPYPVDLGPHLVVAKREGFREVSVRVNAKPHQEISVPLNLVPDSHEATLVVRAAPSDAIFVDGKAVATGSYRARLPSGGYLVRVTGKGKRPFQQDVQLRDDETRTLPVVLEAEPSGGLPTWLVVLATGVAVGAGVGTVVYFSTRPSKSDGVPKGTLDPGIVLTSF